MLIFYGNDISSKLYFKTDTSTEVRSVIYDNTDTCVEVRNTIYYNTDTCVVVLRTIYINTEKHFGRKPATLCNVLQDIEVKLTPQCNPLHDNEQIVLLDRMSCKTLK